MRFYFKSRRFLHWWGIRNRYENMRDRKEKPSRIILVMAYVILLDCPITLIRNWIFGLYDYYYEIRGMHKPFIVGYDNKIVKYKARKKK